MEQNPIDLTQLNPDVKKAVALLLQAEALLKKWGVQLTKEERKKALKPPTNFFKDGPGFLRSVIAHPQLSAGTGKDPKVALDYLQAIEVIAPASELAARVAALLEDTRTAWVNEVYAPSLEYYGVAKVIGKKNADIQTVVDSLSETFPGHHPKNQTPKEGGDKAAGDKPNPDSTDATK